MCNQDNETSFNNDASSTAPPAQISLTDCLACSGCVTSAEAVLVSLQSHAEVLQTLDSSPGLRLRREGSRTVVDALDQGGKLFVASVSPQTRASIAATFNVGEQEASYMIQHLLSGPRGIKNRAIYRNAFHWVLDTSVAREVCLELSTREVMASLEHKTDPASRASPILTSACPGWICYAEKTHPYTLPHMSRLKSPQALLGTLVKSVLSRNLGISPDRIWHVAVMPCFDKKLEASREELTDAYWKGGKGKGVRDVDCVITSKELLMLAESRGVDFASLPRTPPVQSSSVPFPDAKIHSFLFPSGRKKRSNVGQSEGTSGGYLHHTLQHVASQHAGAKIQTQRGRNADVSEYSIVSATGEVIFKAARYYGFRNIQNLVRRLKPSTASRMPGGRVASTARRPASKSSIAEYAYVEVMACPGGCTNGGGQIKPDDPIITARSPDDPKIGAQEQRSWLAQVDEAYFSGEEAEHEAIEVVDVEAPIGIDEMLSHWSLSTGIDVDRLVYTSFREVISNVGKSVTDTERAIEIAGKIGGGW